MRKIQAGCLTAAIFVNGLEQNLGCTTRSLREHPRQVKKQEDHDGHLSKQICVLTVEVSAKFTALRFMYKFYSPGPPHPPPLAAMFFSCIMMA